MKFYLSMYHINITDSLLNCNKRDKKEKKNSKVQQLAPWQNAAQNTE